MAYRNRGTNLRSGLSPAKTLNTNRGKSASVELTLNADATYSCFTNKSFTDSFTIKQELGQDDGFIKLIGFSKDIESLSLRNAQAIVIKNISNICAEILIEVADWRNDSASGSYTTGDVANSVDMNTENSTGESTVFRHISMLIPANEFIYLPTSRLIEYSPLAASTPESAALAPVGTIAIEPSAINSSNEYRSVKEIASQAYGTGTAVLVNDGDDMTITDTTMVVDDGAWFKVDDLLRLGNGEIVRVTSVSVNNIEIKRGLLGSTTAAIADDATIDYFFGNEYLVHDNGECITTKDGKFKQSGAFFGYGRTEDKLSDGIVPGSIAIGPFYTEGGYLDWGLNGITPQMETGLVVSTEYTFHILVDEHNAGGIDSTTSETAIAFTSDAIDTTFSGSNNSILSKIQARFDTLYYDASSGLYNKRVTIKLHNGDVRVISGSNRTNTRIGIANVSGTSPFGVGRFPALSSGVPVLLGSPHGGGTTDTIVYGPIAALAPETIDDRKTGKSNTNIGAFIFDDGNGNLLHNGQSVGWIDYEKGHCEWTVGKFPSAMFKIYGQSHSAHSGGASYVANGYNTIQQIKGRSVNPIENTKIEIIMLG